MLSCLVSHDSLISSRIANWKKRNMFGFGLFLGKFAWIANSKNESTSELCYTNHVSMLWSTTEFSSCYLQLCKLWTTLNGLCRQRVSLYKRLFLERCYLASYYHLYIHIVFFDYGYCMSYECAVWRVPILQPQTSPEKYQMDPIFLVMLQRRSSRPTKFDSYLLWCDGQNGAAVRHPWFINLPRTHDVSYSFQIHHW